MRDRKAKGIVLDENGGWGQVCGYGGCWGYYWGIGGIIGVLGVLLGTGEGGEGGKGSKGHDQQRHVSEEVPDSWWHNGWCRGKYD